jgi:hypothetical protein
MQDDNNQERTAQEETYGVNFTSDYFKPAATNESRSLATLVMTISMRMVCARKK